MNRRQCRVTVLFLVCLCGCEWICCKDQARATSLWSGETVTASSLYVDKPAPPLHENDIVVIILEEQSTAFTDADTEAEVDDTVEGSISNWFSIDNAKNLLDLLRFQSPQVKAVQNDENNLPKWGVEIKNEFEGEAETTRNNTVSARVAARVIAVKPNGNIVLEGRRHIKINDETTILTVTGIARAKDVTEDNTIESSLITELNVAIDGKGIASNANRRGILSHLLNLIR